MENGIYIYGIIKTSEPCVPGERDIGDKAVSNLRSVGFKDIAAVVSSSPVVDYRSLSKETIVKNLATHELVLEKIMSRCTILPVKFGTMVEFEKNVIEFLENGYVLLNNELDKAEGKVEMDVTASWELPKILAVLSRRNARLREKQQQIEWARDQASLEEKILLGQYIEQALKAEKDKCQQLMLQTLKQEALDVCLHDLASDESVFNAAFLLKKDGQEAFYAALQALDQELEGTINFRVVGPLPLYSFASVLFEKMNPEQIEEARKALGLTEEITDGVLRDAYYQLAKEYHPDKQGEESSIKFQQLQNAYRTLRNFIENGYIHTEIQRWT